MERIKAFVILLIIASAWCELALAKEETTSTATKPAFYRSATTSNSRKDLHECGSDENRHIGNFTLYDYSIVIGMLVISLGIGVFYGFFDSSSENTSSDFLHGSEMSLLPVALSLTTSFITAIELLGNPSEITFYGTQFSVIGKYLMSIYKSANIECEYKCYYLFLQSYPWSWSFPLRWKSSIRFILNCNWQAATNTWVSGSAKIFVYLVRFYTSYR